MNRNDHWTIEEFRRDIITIEMMFRREAVQP